MTTILVGKGQMVDLDTFSESDVDIEVIAGALSKMCRFGGHPEFFYSVAEHSILVSRECEKVVGRALGLAGLLHDAAEAYLWDSIRPLKSRLYMLQGGEGRVPNITRLVDVEIGIQMKIFEAFGVDPGLALDVMPIDDRMLETEWRHVMGQGWSLMNVEPYAWDGHGRRTCHEVELEFLKRFEELTDAGAQKAKFKRQNGGHGQTQTDTDGERALGFSAGSARRCNVEPV